MDRNGIIAMLYFLRRRRNKRQRLHWIHPILQKREELGAFYILFEELREDENKFFNYFRMSVSSFNYLHSKLKQSLQRQNTKMRNCIQPVEMLAIFIRYLASGCTFTDLHYSYLIRICTASNIVRRVCTTIWRVMLQECIPTPTQEQWESIALQFERRANFPHCLSAVDGKHIRIIKPLHSGSMFYNYKEYFSLVLMAMADANYRFVYVDIGPYGKDCDSTGLKSSVLWESLEDGRLELPTPKPLPGTDGPDVPYFFLGDEGFALHKHLLRPFSGSHLTVSKRVYNLRLCRARRYVECTFGILSNRWRIFHRPLNVNTDFAVDIVKACVVLHNFVRDRDGYSIEDTMTVTGLEDLPHGPSVRGGLTANNVRNIVADYFMTNVGAVSWQMSRI